MKYGKLNLYKAKPGTPGGYAHIIAAEAGRVKFVVADKDENGVVYFSKAQRAFIVSEADFLKVFAECTEQRMLYIDA